MNLRIRSAPHTASTRSQEDADVRRLVKLALANLVYNEKASVSRRNIVQMLQRSLLYRHAELCRYADGLVGDQKQESILLFGQDFL
jgi:hypothetical protein